MGIINTIVQFWWIWLITAAISGTYVIRYYCKQFQEAKKMITGKRGSFNFDEANEKVWEGLWSTIIMMMVFMISSALLIICVFVGILRAA